MTTTSDYTIYVTCLASYNSGVLHGAWIDAAQDPEDIAAEVSAMLAASPTPGAEEWAIHSFDMGGVQIDEYESWDRVSALALALEKHGPAFAAFWDSGDCEGLEPDEWVDAFADAYVGEYSSEAEFAEELTRDCHQIPEFLEYYIDWEAMARDLFMSDYRGADSSSGVYVFSRN